ncbi:MAG TPA: hypothetical protein ENK57_14895 [Polyangiaceae bacterium]|nr:hypothetical protein [Polyangiaceae bacterium]
MLVGALKRNGSSDKRLRVAIVLATLALGCSGTAPTPTGPQAAQQAVQNRLAGVWRVTSYIPDHTLSPALLLSMQSDKILVRFDQGRLRSATTGLTFDRAYRIGNVQGAVFSVFILDESGVEYESRARFDEGGNIQFQTVTEPWTGRGLLQREGPAISTLPSY